MSDCNTRVLYKSAPNGLPSTDNFEISQEAIPEPGPGEFLLQNLYLSLDPYMRMLMGGGWTYSPNTLAPGDLMVGRVIGRVVKTLNPEYPEGTMVVGRLGWQTHVVSNGENLDFIVENTDRIQLSAYLGVCGSTGTTAWIGLKQAGRPKPGETVLVSAAAGSVGSTVGQLAKAWDCKAIGIAGGPQKCKMVVEEFGFDACVDYKAEDLKGQIALAAPEGVDVYFDNVGGVVLEAALANMNRLGRIPVCGVLSAYNETSERYGIKNMHLFFDKSLSMEGFVLSAHKDLWLQARVEIENLILNDQLVYKETISEGIESAPSAFIGMLKGKNIGKQLVKFT